MTQRVLDRILNPKEVAELLNIKLPTLFSHMSRGTPLPPSFRVGSQTRWRKSVVWEWILEREETKARRNFEK
jgi:predicted DNA-binding transcriptional regulator AlpA